VLSTNRETVLPFFVIDNEASLWHMRQSSSDCASATGADRNPVRIKIIRCFGTLLSGIRLLVELWKSINMPRFNR
jgi:hypothetical protein